MGKRDLGWRGPTPTPRFDSNKPDPGATFPLPPPRHGDPKGTRAPA